MIITSDKIIKKLLILFLLIAGLYYAKEFLMPLAIAAVLATLFLPLCKRLEKFRIPRGLAILSCILILLLSIGGIISMLGWQISELSKDFALIKERIISTLARTQEYIFSNFGMSPQEQSQLLKNQQSTVTGMLQTMAGSLAGVFSNFILILVYIFLLLYYRIHIKNFILKLVPIQQKAEMEDVIHSATDVSQQYLFGLTKMIVCLWIMYGIGFSLLGLKNAFFFAILCGLLEIIPFIGNLTGTLLTLLVAAVHGAGLPLLGGIAVTYGAVQLIQGWVLEPLILGPQVKINPLFTILALVLGNLVWGIPGIILAIPLIAIIKIVCDHIDSLKPYGFLIGEIESGKKEPGFVKKLKNWFNRNG